MSADQRVKVIKTDAEWKNELTPEQYRVTRQHGTERPFSSPLNGEKRAGMFNCPCCGVPLFSTDTKFEISSWLMRRTEVRCASCDAHLGQVFPDGPKPTAHAIA